MTTDPNRALERTMPKLFTELAQARTPDYLEAAIERASDRPQRPSWTFPERWIPMELVTQRVPTARMPWRQIGVLALIAVLLAAALAIYVGSRVPKIPAPFGPAANGVIAMGRNGDLYTVDPLTGQESLVVGGPGNDEWIDFTPDGTRGVFVRWGPEGPMQAARIGMVALASASEPVFIDKDVIHGDSAVQLAPDGRSVAFTAFDYGGPVLRIHLAALDGSSYHQYDTVDITDYGGLQFLAPDGREVVYLSRSTNGHTHDIRALDLTTGETRAILETSVNGDIFGNVSASPDGKHLAYALAAATGGVIVHIVGSDGSGDTIVGHAPGATFEAWPQWDPQGRRLLIERDGDGVVRPVVIDLNGGPDVVIDTTISQNGAGKMWAPDGSSILAQRTAADGRQLQQEWWDVRTGKVTPVLWPSTTPPAWQRKAF